MNKRESFQNETLENIKALAKEISQVNTFSGLLMHQQKMQILYEKFIFLKQFHSLKFQQHQDESKTPSEIENEYSQTPVTEIYTTEIHTEEINTIPPTEPVHAETPEIVPEAKEVIQEESTPAVSDHFNHSQSIITDPYLYTVFTRELFLKDSGLIDTEIEKLNNAQSLPEAKKWVEEMFRKYNWSEKQDYVEQLSRLIFNKFAEVQEGKQEEPAPSAPEPFTPLIFTVWEEKIKHLHLQKNPTDIQMDFSDTIDFISHLFNGNKANMDAELQKINSLTQPSDSVQYLKELYVKYNWKKNEKSAEKFFASLVKRFEEKPEDTPSVEKLKPISVEIAEIKPKNTDKADKNIQNPIKLDLNDSIAFISQLFDGSKTRMDEEIKNLNSFSSMEDSLKYLSTLSAKNNWGEKKEYIQRFTDIITQRFK